MQHQHQGHVQLLHLCCFYDGFFMGFIYRCKVILEILLRTNLGQTEPKFHLLGVCFKQLTWLFSGHFLTLSPTLLIQVIRISYPSIFARCLCTYFCLLLLLFMTLTNRPYLVNYQREKETWHTETFYNLWVYSWVEFPLISMHALHISTHP